VTASAPTRAVTRTIRFMLASTERTNLGVNYTEVEQAKCHSLTAGLVAEGR
jgi:hypothetical protein